MDISRRSLIGGSAALGFAALLPMHAWAFDSEGSELSPDQALARLRAGNAQFVRAERPTYPIDDKRRREIARGQTPFAAIIGCADSRVGPEQLFSQGLGELFVVRNAGNTVATDQSEGSVEYSVAELKVPLIVVLGHTKCGAIKEATHLVEDRTDFPGSLEGLLLPLVPAVLAVRGQPGDPIDNAVAANVRRVVRALRSPDQPLLYPPQRAGRLKVVGGVYNLETGVVDFIDLPGDAAH